MSSTAETTLGLPPAFWSKVDTSGDCWIWVASLTAQGYGHMRIPGGGYDYAHRLAYTAAFGPIPAGLVIDHLCRRRECCNPAHLEAVTQSVNVRRGAGVFDFTGRCMSGRHEITGPADVRPMKRGGTCRACERESDAIRYALVKAAAAALGMPITHFIRAHGQSVRAARRVLAEVAA